MERKDIRSLLSSLGALAPTSGTEARHPQTPPTQSLGTSATPNRRSGGHWVERGHRLFYLEAPPVGPGVLRNGKPVAGGKGDILLLTSGG